MATKEELDTLQVGDVVLFGSSLRVVRGVHWVTSQRTGESHVRSLTFAIQHCSWTHRTYTAYNSFDLRYKLKNIVARGGVVNGTPLERELQRAIDAHWIRKLQCCDVVGKVQ